jgi:drug/metabolite transporter (DMT)-like permease
MHQLLGIGVAVVAALAYNLGLALQSERLRSAPAGAAAVRVLVRDGVFLTGFALTATGFVLEVVALHLQPLAVVQPILAAGVLVLPPAERILHGQRIHSRLVVAILAVVGGVELVTRAVDHSLAPQVPGTAALAVAATVVTVLMATQLTPRLPAPARPVLAGIGFGSVAVLLKVAAVSSAGSAPQLVAAAAVIVIGPLSLSGEYAALRTLRAAIAAPFILAISTATAELAALALLHEHAKSAAELAAGLTLVVAAAGWILARASQHAD